MNAECSTGPRIRLAWIDEQQFNSQPGANYDRVRVRLSLLGIDLRRHSCGGDVHGSAASGGMPVAAVGFDYLRNLRGTWQEPARSDGHGVAAGGGGCAVYDDQQCASNVVRRQ